LLVAAEEGGRLTMDDLAVPPFQEAYYSPLFMYSPVASNVASWKVSH